LANGVTFQKEGVMARLINQLIPIVLLVAGVIALAVSGLDGGGGSAVVGFPLFLSGFLWLLYPSFCERRRNS
jgi:hypothetical protein